MFCKTLLITIITGVFIFTCHLAKCQDNTTSESYKFDTTLSHGYSLFYKIDDSLQYLYLRHGNKLDKISWEYKESKQSMLGYIAHDFDKHFVLLHTLHVVGNEDPMSFELFEKNTARVVLKGYYIDAMYSVMLYHDEQMMRLYNVNTGKTEAFDFPELGNWRKDKLVNMIRLKKITPKTMEIEYYADAEKMEAKTKVYTR